jgi:pantoate--beta-alanine ligase
MIKILKTPEELAQYRRQLPKEKRVGFVPTMGALHQGHQTLLQLSRKNNDISVLSIFVNPTQFNDPNDLEKYPRTWESDLSLAQSCGVDVLFAPEFASIYPDDYKFKISESDFSLRLCGAHRPGHFDGVLTVVMKLFHLVDPDYSYFGEKDFQQLKLIENMASAFFMKLKIVGVPTVRESDGLALSSRNARLTPAERNKAPLLYKIITIAKSAAEAVQLLEQNGFRVDYVEDLYQRRIAAAFLGTVRLIDNVEIQTI